MKKGGQFKEHKNIRKNISLPPKILEWANQLMVDRGFANRSELLAQLIRVAASTPPPPKPSKETKGG